MPDAHRLRAAARRPGCAAGGGSAGCEGCAHKGGSKEISREASKAGDANAQQGPSVRDAGSLRGAGARGRHLQGGQEGCQGSRQAEGRCQERRGWRQCRGRQADRYLLGGHPCRSHPRRDGAPRVTQALRRDNRPRRSTAAHRPLWARSSHAARQGEGCTRGVHLQPQGAQDGWDRIAGHGALCKRCQQVRPRFRPPARGCASGRALHVARFRRRARDRQEDGQEEGLGRDPAPPQDRRQRGRVLQGGALHSRRGCLLFKC
mmetsp:Transcript_15970/g.34669  ORF Transcript_15970/g.34669 Transcript_15970/m.34669 type:complete len:261 (-) Transcript_15970:54-836(-)